jgi:hypothetical protein
MWMFMPVLASAFLDPPFYRKRGFKNFIFLLGHPLARAHRARLVPFSHCRGERKRDAIHRVKYWELVADNLSKPQWSWGWCGNRGLQRANNLDCRCTP